MIHQLLILLGDWFYYDAIRRELKNATSVLDVGCGVESPLSLVKKTFYSVGIDKFKPSIQISKKKKIHDRYLLMDVKNIDKKFKKKSFDVVISLDLIEHISKKDGFRLLKKMEAIAKKKVIVLTPNGFISQDPFENNPYQVHRSGWSTDDFSKHGYAVYGMRGLRFMRGEYATLKYKPWFMWGMLSFLSQFIAYRMPSYAYQLFAIKTK
jgi:SAM-dependent methyltransferase